MAKEYAPELKPEPQTPPDSQQTQTNEFSSMNTKQKLVYFFTYYKWHVFFIILGIFCICSLTKAIYKNSRPIFLSVAVINNTEQTTGISELIEAFRTSVGAKTSDRVMIDTEYQIDPETTDAAFQAASSSRITDHEALSIKSFNGFYDVILCDEKGLAFCSTQDVVYPLDVYFPDDIQQALAAYTVSGSDVDGNTRPFAVDVSEVPAIKALGLSYETVYLTFPNGNSDSYRRAVSFLNYLLGTNFSKEDTD